MARKFFLLVLIAVVVLGLLAAGGFFAYQEFFSTSPGLLGDGAAPSEHRVTMGPTYAIDPFVVNLADPGRPRYLKVTMQVEADGEGVRVELERLKPRLRDSLLTLLSSKTSDELATVADKERLRNEILHRLNTFLTGGEVVEVYFMEFVVQ